MKMLVLLATVLALCVPAFGVFDPNGYAVLVYKVKANISVVDFEDDTLMNAEFGTGKVDGYVLARFERNTLNTYTGGDPTNNGAIFILLDKKAKEYVIFREANSDEEVEFAFDNKKGDPIFNKVNMNGKDTNQDYIWGSLYVNSDDPNTGTSIFNLNAWDGLTQLTPSVIEGSTKISVPKSIKFNNAMGSSDINLSRGYKTTVSATLDSNYTKLATGNDWTVAIAASWITTDLDGKGWSEVSVADYFNWDVTL
jgi:hypothetical protein